MSKTRDNYAKLLDAWSPPNDAGDPIGCVATSYTFNSAFFEEDCLGRFVKMETQPDTDGPVYLIEREEKFSSLKCAAALVDKDHCLGARSLRWDLIPFRHPNGILHAKISLLGWSQMVRVIIGSANLTESGYRSNQEIFGVLDYYPKSELPREVLEEVVRYLARLIDQVPSAGEIADIGRWRRFLDSVLAYSAGWGSTTPYRGAKDVRVYPVLLDPVTEDVFSQVREKWSLCSHSPPSDVVITSPFFDDKEPNGPAKEIWRTLNQRGSAAVMYKVLVEEIPGSDEEILLRCPETLNNPPSGRMDVSVSFEAVSELVEDEKGKNTNRALHHKSMYFSHNEWDLFLVGSSNFTSAGTGVGHRRNFEANLGYAVSSSQNAKASRQLRQRLIPGEKIDPGLKWKWQAQPNLDEYSDDVGETLHLFFGPAYYDVREGNPVVVLTFFGEEALAGFSVLKANEQDEIFSEKAWETDGRPTAVAVPWDEDSPPSGFWVTWKDAQKAWWPVNVMSFSVLPPPIEIRDLPLEVLIRILSSARPLHQVMRPWLKKLGTGDQLHLKPELDPHKRVDTSGFLIQRTRRISYALTALREKLSAPVFTKETLEWRLYGPVGVKALCDAILREAHSDEERAFLLAETALELSQVEPREVENSLPADVIRKEIKKLITAFSETVQTEYKKGRRSIRDYIKSSFKRAVS